MAKTVFDGNKNSQYDSDLIIKEVHDFYGQSLRTLDTRSLISEYYTHLRSEYDVNDKPVEVNYYRGTKAHKTTFNVTSATSLLDGAYFTINSAPDNQKWVVWFNLDGTSVQPVVINANYIEIEINTGDSAEVVALAITLTLNTLYKNQFFVTKNNSNLEIETIGLGIVDASNEATVPFSFVQIEGAQELVKKVTIEYSGSDPIYEGQVLKGYVYDIYSGKFIQKIEINVDNIDVNLDSITDSVTIGDIFGNKATISSGRLRVETDLNLDDIEAKLDLNNQELQDINTSTELNNSKLDDIIDVLNNSLQIEQPILTAGTIDGTINGTKYPIVYNAKQQILDSHDRIANFTYADFGTKNQRITQIDYTSSTFPGITIRRVFNYSLVGNNYRRDEEIWSEI